MKNSIKKLISLILAAVLGVGCFMGRISVSAQEDTDVMENSFDFAVKTAEIIKNNESSMLRIMGKLRHASAVSDFPYSTDCVISDDGRFVMQFSTEKDLLDCLEKLQNNPDVIYAERDVPVYTGTISESAKTLSWGVKAIEADIYSQKLTPSSGNSVVVAIIDSGSEDIDFIKDKLVPGYDFFENDSDAFQDESIDSHGTFLAGIVADCVGNLPIKIMPVRILDSKQGSLINLINGIRYAVENGADVINLSLCATLTNCISLEYAIEYANDNGVTVVVCAGNAKSDVTSFCPSHCESVLTVSSVNSAYEFSEGFSNFGESVDFAAPGESIIGYNAKEELIAMSGTSLSTAFISAAAAMFILDNPDSTTSQVHNSLASCSKDYGESGWDIYYGWGIPKLGNLEINTKVIPVESVAFPQNSYTLSISDMIEIIPVFSPADSTDKSFILSADNSNVTVNGNVITAVSAGKTVVTITTNDGSHTASAEITIVDNTPEITASVRIKNKTDNKTINYGETLRLTAEITSQTNETVFWYVDGIKRGEGLVFEVSPESGSVEVVAKLVDSNGNILNDKNGNEISDSQKVSVNSGFFQKLISFFKNLFGINRTVIQTLIK